MSDTSTQSGGIGFVGLLTIVFIVMKLLEKIDWSWWWVLSPLWVAPTFFIVVGAVALGLAWLVDRWPQ